MSWAEGPWSRHSTRGARQGESTRESTLGGSEQALFQWTGCSLQERGPQPLRSQRAPHCTPDGSVSKRRGRGGWGGILGWGGGAAEAACAPLGGLPSIPWPSLTPHPGFTEPVPGPAHSAHGPQRADCQTHCACCHHGARLESFRGGGPWASIDGDVETARRKGTQRSRARKQAPGWLRASRGGSSRVLPA